MRLLGTWGWEAGLVEGVTQLLQGSPNAGRNYLGSACAIAWPILSSRVPGGDIPPRPAPPSLQTGAGGCPAEALTHSQLCCALSNCRRQPGHLPVSPKGP